MELSFHIRHFVWTFLLAQVLLEGLCYTATAAVQDGCPAVMKRSPLRLCESSGSTLLGRR